MMAQIDGFLGDFAAKAAQVPERVFARFEGAPISFGELDALSSSFAAHLRQLGIERGGRVAVMMRNSRHSLAILFGLARAGVVWVPLNVQQKGEGLAYILGHCGADAVICDRDCLPAIRDCGAQIDPARLIVAGDPEAARPLEAILARPLDFEEALPAPQDLFGIMYTSGTTGRPKGVLVTHGMMRLAGEAVKHLTRARAGDVFLVWEPLYHIGGAQLIVLPVLEDVALAMVERFSASRFWPQVRSYNATHIHYLGGILQILLKQPERPDDREHPVRVAWGGGCPKGIWSRFRDRFGVEMRECYGMTEASSITTCNDSGVEGAVGRPMPWFSVEILDQTGAPAASGEKGEIVVRSSLEGALFSGYLDDPEATAKALRGGALHTGDCGALDADGVLWFHGRLSDSVRCKGENVSAWEVEHVAGGHPAVEDCAMIGVAAEIGEQDIKLFVKAKAGCDIDPAALFAWLSERLAAYQVPRYLEVVAEFERTPSQRIMKHRLSRDIGASWDRLTVQIT